MVEVNNTNDDTPSIRSILTDNSDYLSDIVKTLNTNIAPSIEKISKTIITIDKRDQKSQENAEYLRTEREQEAERGVDPLSEVSQAVPQTTFGGSKAGGALAGLGAAGAGLGAFFLALAGAEAIMTKFGSGDNIKSLLTNLAEGLSAFSTKEFLALGTVLAAGALFGSVGGVEEAVQAGVGITAMGAGIAGFLVALSGADAVISAFGSDGSSLVPLLSNVADAISAFDNQSLKAVGIALGASAALGALFGVGKAAKANVGIIAMGAGIAGFLAALSGADWAASKLGADGSSIGPLLKNVGEGLSSFSSTGLTALGVALGSGALLGLFPGGALAATTGIAAVGVGIGAFLTALSVADWAGGKLGSKGENIGPLLENVGNGLKAFEGINPVALAGIGAALIPLEAGLLAFFGGEGLRSLVGSGLDAIKGAWNWLTGNDDPIEKKGAIQSLVEELEPLKDLDLAEVDKLDKFSSSLNNFALSMNQLGDMDVGDIEGNIGEIAENISKALPVIRVMVKGGTIGEGFFDGYPEMDFGPEGEGGLLNPDLKLDELTVKARQLRGVFDANIEPQQPQLRGVFDANIEPQQPTQQSPLRPPMQMPYSIQPPVPVVIVPNVQTNQIAPESIAINALSPQAVAPVNITNVSNVGNSVDNSSTAVSAGGGSGPVHAARTYNGDPILQSVMRPGYAG